MEVKTLRQYAQEHGIGYRAAWDRFKAGKIPEAYQDECSRILIPVPTPREEYVVCYARVSSSENRKNLEAQAERLAVYCSAKGYAVHQVVKEVGSGLNDRRPKLLKVLQDPRVTRIVVEHHDRLTRFGFHYLQAWMAERGCTIEVINEVTQDREDLRKDFISLVTSFVARLYGLRRSHRKTEQILRALETADADTPVE